MSSLPRLLLGPALLALASPGSVAAPAPSQSEPFGPGLRWTLAAPLAEPWIPGSVAFAGRDQLVWAAGAGAGARLIAAPSAGFGPLAPLFVDPGLAGTSGSLLVAGASGEHALFALCQRPAPDPWRRRTEVTRHDVLEAARGGAFDAAWTVDLGLAANGPGRLAADAAGSVVVAAAFDSAAQLVTVAWIDGRSGGPLAQLTLGADSLREVAVSADGRRTALLSASTLHLFTGPGVQHQVQALESEASSLALSAQGDLVAVGGRGRVQVYAGQAGGALQARPPIAGGLHESALELGLSADGSTLGVAWWDTSGAGVTRLEVRDALQGNLHVARGFPGAPGGLQNTPQAVRLTEDGSRVAFATWGNGGGVPQVLLLERSSGATLLEATLPGSALDLALDASGTRLAVVTKNVHANQFGSTGEVRLYDTGERDLELLGQPRHGGRLRLAARAPGATQAYFLLGRPSAPQAFPGGVGELCVERSARLWILPSPVDPAGRADLDLPLPADPGLIGVELRAQAALRVDGGLQLSRHPVDLLVL